jgi:tetratricopeptide (TPR) repeat protein
MIVFLFVISLALAAPNLSHSAQLGWMNVNIVPPDFQKPPAPPPTFVKAVAVQLEKGCSPGTAENAPFADLAPLRGTQNSNNLAETDKKRLIAATFSQDPETAKEILSPMLDSGSTEVRFIAASTLALLIARNIKLQKYFKLFDRMLETMEAAVPANDRLMSDLFYFKGLKHHAQGQRRMALIAFDEAIRLDPYYFNALAHAIRLQLAETSENRRRGNTLCRKAYDKLLNYAVQLMDINPCPLQSAHISIWLHRQYVVPNQIPAINALDVYIATLARRPRAAEAALAAFKEKAENVCERYIAEQLAQVVALLDDSPAFHPNVDTGK